MNGPGHYREAEQLLAAVVGGDQSPCVDDEYRLVSNTIAAAQVHATLALAAAAALPASAPPEDNDNPDAHDRGEWYEVTS